MLVEEFYGKRVLRPQNSEGKLSNPSPSLSQGEWCKGSQDALSTQSVARSYKKVEKVYQNDVLLR